jgi:hypothetical protein
VCASGRVRTVGGMPRSESHAPGEPRRRRFSRFRQPLFLGKVALALALLLVVAELLATPLARSYTRKALANLQGYRGVVADVHASFFPPTYEVTRLKIIPARGGDWKDPLLYAERVRLKVFWRALLQGRLVAAVVADDPKLSVVQRTRSGLTPADVAKKVPALARELEKAAPLTVDRITVNEGELLVSDATQKPPARLWLHDVEGRAENLVTRRWLARGRPARLRFDGQLQKSGRFMAEVSADPWEKTLTFHGRTAVENLSARDLGELLQAKSGVKPSEGTIDVFAEFDAKDGFVEGGVKTLVHGLELEAADGNPVNHLKEWLGDAAIDLFSRDVGGKRGEQLATVVPIRGRIEEADAQLWPTVLALVRNAFVEGISSGFEHVPPPTAKKKQGVIEQAADALQKGEGPVKSQPRGRK